MDLGYLRKNVAVRVRVVPRIEREAGAGKLKLIKALRDPTARPSTHHADARGL